MNTIIERKLTSKQLELLKLVKISYSEHREEIYIDDFNDERLFQVNLWDGIDTFDELDELKKEFIINGEVYNNQVIYLYDNEIEDILYNKYFHTSLGNIILESFHVANFPDYVDDTLYTVYFDYTYMILYASDEDSALIKCDEILQENGYYDFSADEQDEPQVLYNGVLQVLPKN